MFSVCVMPAHGDEFAMSLPVASFRATRLAERERVTARAARTQAWGSPGRRARNPGSDGVWCRDVDHRLEPRVGVNGYILLEELSSRFSEHLLKARELCHGAKLLGEIRHEEEGPYNGAARPHWQP